MKRILPLLAAFLLLQGEASEPSAFGAGNLDSAQPYGLTATEKEIVENRKNLQNAKRLSQENSEELRSLRERLDGLQTIIESLNEKAQDNKRKMGELENANMGVEANRDQKLAALEEAVKANEANIAALKSLLQTLAGQVDRINAEYVSKTEYNRLVDDINAFKRDLSKTLKGISSAEPADSYARLSSKTLALNAEEAYGKRFFKKAIPMYEELIRRNYKPAYAHFMIGEMWHYRKSWSKALSYYKESVSRHDNASYMPTLMLHSAECMMHTGDSANAKKFLQSIRAKYPDSSEAAEAAALLNTL